MKKRVLSMFMALALCLTLLPTAALADELGPVDGTSTVETAGADAEAEAKAKAGAEAVAAVQAMISELPSLGELKGMDSDTLNESYMAVQSAYDAYEALSAEQQAQVTGADRFEELFGWFNSQVAPLADADVKNIWIDVVDLATGEMTQGKQNWTATPLGNSNGNLTLTGGNMYVVGENQKVTIDGDLTMAGNSRNYLILFNGAKLIINGALILEQNGLSIYSHTASQDLDTIGQITINNSENPTGAAIRSSAGSALTLNLCGGKLTAKANGDYGAVSNVYLSRGTAPYPLKAALGGELLSPADWAFTAVNSPANKDLVIEWCTHPDEYDSYVDNGDGLTHHLKCDLCGFEWLEKNQAAETESQIGHFLTYTILNDTYHKGTCRECGAEIAQEKHEPMKDPDGNPVYSPTLDGKGHVSGACACGYSSGTVADHNYSDYGTCTVCDFTPIATDAVDENGNATGSLYESIEEAIAKKVTELWLVSYEKDATTKEYTNTLRKNLKIDEGVTLTLHMNGVKLEGTAGNPALTVSGGTLTVKDDANIVSPDVPGGTTEFSATPAVSVTSGSLVFEGAVTATGGKYSNKVASAIEVSGGKLTFNGEVNAKAESIDTAQPSGYTLAPAINVTGGEVTFAQKLTATGGIFKDGTNLSKQEPAVYATSGTLDFKGDLDLNGGLTLTKSAKLANLLTQGTFSVSAGTGSSPLSVKDSSVYKKVSDLLAEGYACVKTDSLAEGKEKEYANTRAYTCSDNVTIVKHEHEWKLDSQYPHLHSCACGKSENHEYDSSTGKCKICQSECSHKDVDNDGTCFTCKAQMLVKIENGGNTTYSTDFKAAMEAAENGTTITLLADIELGTTPQSRAEITGDGKIVTLNLNGHTITGGWIDIGDNNNPTSCTLKIIGEGGHESLGGIGGYSSVSPRATLDLSEWEGGTISAINISDSSNYEATTREAAVIVGPNAGTIGKLTFGNNQLDELKKTKLSGGSFNEIWAAAHQPVKLGDLLADGYAYQNEDGSYVKYETTLQGASIRYVKVVKCLHSNMEPDATGVATCEYCGKSGKFAASVDGNLYTDMNGAIDYWLENGGTLKLYGDYTAADGTWKIGSGSHTINLNGHKMSVQGDGNAFKPTNNMHLTVTDGTELGQITNILLDGDQRGSFTLENGFVGNLKMTGGAVVALKGGSVDNLDVQDCSENTNLSIQGGSLGKLNIKDWAEGMHVSATGGSLGAYTLPSGKILADVLDHQYYAEGTSLDRQVDTAQPTEKFVIKHAPYDFGSTSKAANVPINGRIPFRVDSPSENVGVYLVKWYRRTNSGAVHLTENKVANVNVGDTLDVFCVITGVDKPNNGTVLWQVAVKGYKLTVAPADLSQGAVVFKQVGESMTGLNLMGNIRDGKGTFVFTPYGGDVNNASTLTYCFEVSHDGQKLIEGKDYTIESGNTAQYAGDHTLTIQGIGSYAGTATHTWRIEPYKLTRENYNPPNITKEYDGTTGFDFSKDSNWGSFKENVANRPNDAGTGKNPILGGDTNAISIYLKPEDLKASAVTLDSPDVGDRTASYTITLKARDGQREPNFVFEDGEPPTIQVTAPAYITKAFLSSSPEAGKLNVANNHPATYTVDLKALLPTLESPKEYGKVTYELGAVSINGGYYDAAKGSAEVKDGKLILPIQAVATEVTGNIGTVTVKVTSGNIVDFPLLINVDATNKIVPTGEPTLSTKTLTYGQALSAIKLSGKLHDNVNNKDVEGTFTWADGTVKPSAGSYEAAWKFTPADGDTYIEADGTVTITVNKATPTGAPTYTAITTGGKTLADAALTANAGWPSGTVQWVDKDGKPLPASTQVQANTEYTWSFTPADAANYNGATGSVTLYAVSSGGGGGGSSSGSTVKTDTVTNPDGSVTKTETKSDGTVVETTTGKDGSTTKTETKKDGSSVTENKAADGSTGTVKTDKHGQTTAETTLSSKAIEDAKRNGEPVKAPVEVKTTRNSDSAPVVKVELPRNSGETKVEIPVTNVKPGTVAVLVHPDGTEEIVKNSLPTEDGIQLTVDGSATVKIVDNSKDFIDTRNHWAKDAIDFVSARGLVNGMSATIYAPNASTTRAQLWTILARQNNADLNGGNTWYEKAQLWSKNKGISDGTEPNAAINRAQMVTMLWRTMGQPAAGGSASFADVPADSYYAQAVAWAVENGITAGVGNGRFDPNSTCTRAQIATFLWRAMAE